MERHSKFSRILPSTLKQDSNPRVIASHEIFGHGHSNVHRLHSSVCACKCDFYKCTGVLQRSRFIRRQSQQSGPLQFDPIVAVRRSHPGFDLGLRVLQTGSAFRYTRRSVQTTSESGWTAHRHRHVHGTYSFRITPNTFRCYTHKITLVLSLR